VVLLDFGGAFSHEAHATVLARQIWASLIVPHFHTHKGATT
jgi:hypothetical protein